MSRPKIPSKWTTAIEVQDDPIRRVIMKKQNDLIDRTAEVQRSLDSLNRRMEMVFCAVGDRAKKTALDQLREEFEEHNDTHGHVGLYQHKEIDESKCPDCGVSTERGVDHRCPEELVERKKDIQRIEEKELKQNTAPPRCSNCKYEDLHFNTEPCTRCHAHANWMPKKPKVEIDPHLGIDSKDISKEDGNVPCVSVGDKKQPGWSDVIPLKAALRHLAYIIPCERCETCADHAYEADKLISDYLRGLK